MKKKCIRKAKRLVTLLEIAATAAVVAMTVYSLIPKNEKIKNIDTTVLEAYGSQKKENEEEKAENQEK